MSYILIQYIYSKCIHAKTRERIWKKSNKKLVYEFILSRLR